MTVALMVLGRDYIDSNTSFYKYKHTCAHIFQKGVVWFPNHSQSPRLSHTSLPDACYSQNNVHMQHNHTHAQVEVHTHKQKKKSYTFLLQPLLNRV